MFCFDVLSVCISRGDTETFDLLVGLGADLSITSPEDQAFTLLHQCAHFDNLEILQKLLDAGLDPNEHISNPLHIAAMHESIRCAKVLSQLIDAFSRDRFSATPLHYAIGSVNELLVETILESARIAVEGGFVRYAIEYGSPAILRIILRRYDANERCRGNPPLVYLALLRTESSSFDKLELAEVLIEHGSDINEGNPIEHAINNSHEDLVELLAEKGAACKLPEEFNVLDYRRRLHQMMGSSIEDDLTHDQLFNKYIECCKRLYRTKRRNDSR